MMIEGPQLISTLIIFFITGALILIKISCEDLETDRTWFGRLWQEFLLDYDGMWKDAISNFKAKGIPYESIRVDSSNCFGRGSKTQVHITGRRNNPVLLLIPGYRATSTMWIPSIEELSTKYCVVTLDYTFDVGRSIPGNIKDVLFESGKKQPVFTPFLTVEKRMDTMMSWLRDILKQLEIPQLSAVAGFSLGGYLTCNLALHAPDLIQPKAKLLIIAPPATFSRFRFAHAIPILFANIWKDITGLPFPSSINMASVGLIDYKKELEAGTCELINIDKIIKRLEAKDQIISMAGTFPPIPFNIRQFSIDELKQIVDQFDPTYVSFQWDCWYDSQEALRRAAQANFPTIYKEKTTHKGIYFQPQMFHNLLKDKFEL